MGTGLHSARVLEVQALTAREMNDVVFTNHAIVRLVQRELRPAQIYEVLDRPDRRLPQDDPTCVLLEQRLGERIVSVVVRQAGMTRRILSVWWRSAPTGRTAERRMR